MEDPRAAVGSDHLSSCLHVYPPSWSGELAYPPGLHLARTDYRRNRRDPVAGGLLSVVPGQHYVEHSLPCNHVRVMAPGATIHPDERIAGWGSFFCPLRCTARSGLRLLRPQSRLDPLVHSGTLHPRYSGPGSVRIRSLADLTMLQNTSNPIRLLIPVFSPATGTNLSLMSQTVFDWLDQMLDGDVS